MAVPTETTYSVAAKEDASDAILALIDAGAGAGKIKIRDADDVLLAEVVLDDPGGTVSGVTGQLTLAIATQEDSAPASGTAAYGEITDSDDTVIVAMPAAQGTESSSGYLVLNTLSIIAGGPVNVISATIG
jgi:hypothetical protein